MNTYSCEQALAVEKKCRADTDDLTLPPWPTSMLWAEINQSLAIHLRLYHDHLIRARGYARLIQKDFRRLYPLMDELCSKTCPTCNEICCCHAKPWYDFRDLVYLHICGLQPPCAQPIGQVKDSCRYLTDSGCNLSREKRPWICTWYICPEQKALLDKELFPKGQIVSMALLRIKNHRRILEGEFIKKVAEGIWPSWDGI